MRSGSVSGASVRGWTLPGKYILRSKPYAGMDATVRAQHLLAPGPRAYAMPHQQREQAGSASSAAENARCASIWLKFHASTSPCDMAGSITRMLAHTASVCEP